MKTLAILLATSVLSAGNVALAQTYSVSVGAEYSTGDYGGGAETDVLYVPVALGVDAGDWSVRACLRF